MNNQTALLLIDLQNDFCAGGSLAVPEADLVIPIANQWIQDKRFTQVIASQDFHPKHHLSFASSHPDHQVGDIITVEGLSQFLWPDHCVAHTHGAEFHPLLNTQHINKIIYKGQNPKYDSYSAFFDNGHKEQTELDDYLKNQGINTLYIMGIATDYCVKYTVLDACHLGYDVFLITNGCRGVNIHPDDSKLAIQEMQHYGAKLI